MFRLPIPGLSTCPQKGVSFNDEMLVEIAKSNLIELLSDPHIYEALQLLKREKHRLLSSVGGPHQRKGQVAKNIIKSLSKKEESRLGRPRINRPGLEKLLAGIEKEQQKPDKNGRLVWYCHEIVNTMYSKDTGYKKKQATDELYKELLKIKRRLQYRSRRK